MEAYITPNIDLSENSELSSIVKGSMDTPCWIYKGSLLKHAEHIPLGIKSLIPLNYFLKHGITPYTPEGTELFSMNFTKENSAEVMDKVIGALEEIDFKTTFKDIKRYLAIVAVELVRNGIIQNLKSEREDNITLIVSENEDDIIVKVADPYGTLLNHDFISRFKRVIKTGEYERKRLGAGLGLFMVVSSVSSIYFNIVPNFKTEITCTINKYKRLKHFKEKETAIFFT